MNFSESQIELGKNDDESRKTIFNMLETRPILDLKMVIKTLK
jgi:hypothetical protein